MLDQANAVVKTETGADVTATAQQRFSQLKQVLHAECGDTAYRSWIAPVTLTACGNGALELQAPTRFVRDWVRAHYAERIKALWTRSYGPVARVDIVSAPEGRAANAPVAEQASGDVVPFTPRSDVNVVDAFSSPLDARFTFENYVTGDANAFAFAAARKVAAGEGVTFNPLVVHGPVGHGKTHLLQAIAHEARKLRPQARVVYMSAEKFMFQFVRALRQKDTMAFKEQLRAIDVLMIDDIQFVAGKESTQEEFFHTVHALIEQGKHVVVSADRSPVAIDGLSDRLRSRLSGGLVTAIGTMPQDLRRAVLDAKCAMMNRAVPADVLDFLAQKISSSTRELEGALSRLIAHAELTGQTICLESAAKLLEDILRVSDRRLGVEDILKAVSEHYSLRMSDLLSPRRARAVARPRQMAMYLSKVLTSCSLPDIGRKFGGRDHTTIIHGIRKIEELLQSDNGLQADIAALKTALGV